MIKPFIFFVSIHQIFDTEHPYGKETNGDDAIARRDTMFVSRHTIPAGDTAVCPLKLFPNYHAMLAKTR